MKILHIINTLANGGAQSVLAQLLAGWGDESDRQMVVALGKPEQLSAWIEALGMPIEHINLQSGEVSPRKFLRLIQIIRTYQPDVIQTWLYHSDLIGSFAARLAGRAPIVWGVHHTTENIRSLKRSTASVVRILSLLSHWMPARIICCSDSALRTHIELGYAKEKMIAIWNGIDTARFHPNPTARAQVAKELKLTGNIKMIGMFARYHPQKDHRTLLQAAGVLVQSKPNVHFVLAGEEIVVSNRQLMDLIVETGMQNHIHLLGKRQDMPGLTAGMDIMTLTSAHGEALPQTLGEAMACGVPCVATNIGDVATLIGDTGIIVEPKDARALAQAWTGILDLTDENYAALSNRARGRMLAFYNTARMVAEYKSIYRELKTSK